MTEIENVARPPAGPPQNIFDAPLNFMERGKQVKRIEIPLHGTIMAHHGPGLIKMDAPIDADHIAAGLAHLPKNRRRAGAEMNQGNAFVLEPLKNQLDMRHHIFGIVPGRQTADPAIEQLHRLRAGLGSAVADTR